MRHRADDSFILAGRLLRHRAALAGRRLLQKRQLPAQIRQLLLHFQIRRGAQAPPKQQQQQKQRQQTTA